MNSNQHIINNNDLQKHLNFMIMIKYPKLKDILIKKYKEK